MNIVAVGVLSFLGGAIAGIIVQGIKSSDSEEYGKGYEQGYDRGFSDAEWELGYKGDKEI